VGWEYYEDDEGSPLEENAPLTARTSDSTQKSGEWEGKRSS